MVEDIGPLAHGPDWLWGPLAVWPTLLGSAFIHPRHTGHRRPPVFDGLGGPPGLKKVMTMNAALTTEKRRKRQAQAQLRATQIRFRSLVDAVKDYAIVMMDPEGRVTSWNRGAERLKGYTDEDILGMPYAIFFTPEDQAAGRPERLWRQAIESGRAEEDGWALCKDGTRIYLNGILTSIRGPQGTLQGCAYVTRDITEQRATQAALQNLAEHLEEQVRGQLQELRESEASLQGFIRHASAAIAFSGLDGRYLLVNPKMAAALGRPAEELVGRTPQDLLSPAAWARVCKVNAKVLQTMNEYTAEEEWTHGDGARRQYLVHKFPLVDATGECRGLGVIATDITERKQADLAWLQSQKLESLGVLAGGIAHDFNNLLGAMQGNVELAQAETALEGVKPYLKTLKGLMAKASELLRQMLAYCGQGKSSLHPLDLNEMVQEMTDLLATSISKKASIRLELHPGPLRISADPAQIQQVVMNLVINASEALEEQNGLITLRTSLENLSQGSIDSLYERQALRPGPHACLEVVDSGSGMTEAILKKIFDPFFTTKFTGRGLGLTAIHGIVRSHQGAIVIDSEPGLGSTFKVLFPAVQGAVPPAPNEVSLPPETRHGDNPMGTLLVVDDEEPMRSVVVKALGRVGFQVLEARDGQEALAVFQAHRDRIRLILLDLTMPNMDGEEACRELRRRGAAVPVILSSGFSETDALLRFKNLDLAGFVQKPFSLGELVALIQKVLTRVSR